jgi:hypothetical protein
MGSDQDNATGEVALATYRVLQGMWIIAEILIDIAPNERARLDRLVNLMTDQATRLERHIPGGFPRD